MPPVDPYKGAPVWVLDPETGEAVDWSGIGGGGVGSATAAKQDTIIGHLDGVETSLTNLITKATGPTTGTISTVASNLASVTVLASNADRKGATVYNETATGILYLALSNVTASVTVYSVQLNPGDVYELPVNQGGVYTGRIAGIWDVADGNARVTELT